jgi:hypothetical protein
MKYEIPHRPCPKCKRIIEVTDLRHIIECKGVSDEAIKFMNKMFGL